MGSRDVHFPKDKNSIEARPEILQAKNFVKEELN
jgi:hypothetical protein